jgi:hypothetical protein
LFTLIRSFLSSRAALIAENLFLRKQLALFQELKAKWRRTTPAIRVAMVALARFFDWQHALVVVKTGDVHQMASNSLPDPMAMEVAQPWSPAGSGRTASRISTGKGRRLAHDRIIVDHSQELVVHGAHGRGAHACCGPVATTSNDAPASAHVLDCPVVGCSQHNPKFFSVSARADTL